MGKGYLRIRNWEKWQSYRHDRGQPPWIKIHRQIMRDPNWVSLADAQRGQLVAMWLLAADRNGVIPASPSLLQKLCYMDSEPDLQVFVEYGFIEPDASLTPSRRQSVTPETETETEAYKEEVEVEVKRPLVRENADLDVKGTVKALHEHFCTKRGGRPLKLTKDRAAKYRSRLGTYTPAELITAIDAALEDPFMRGDNDRSTRYDFPESVLKNDAAVDRWLDRGRNGRPGGQEAFLRKADRWMNALDRKESRNGV